MNVSIDDLTGVEQAVLLVLMAESRPVRNPELAALGPKMEKPSRDKLNQLKLIDTTKVSGTLVHELTDAGWRTCGEIFGTQFPPRSSGQGKALYTVLNGLSRYLARADLAPGDVFLPAHGGESEVSAPAADGDVETMVRSAYEQLVRRPGGWVGLAHLRSELADVPRHQLDSALVRMYTKPGVSLIPEENQKVVTAADRAAAVEIGDEYKHLIAIEP